MSVIAPTFYGTIEGYAEEGISAFKGIPYAEAPVGNRRWEHPEPPEAWEGVRDASSFKPHAPQNPSALSALVGSKEVEDDTDENCLYLNVWTPGLDDERRPVMVWIHGGGFTVGAGSQPIYEGKKLAARGNVVVVTINYRLGVLGFLNLNELTQGTIPSTGNEGLMDQVEALCWVRDNILGFGGDPDNVTVFGESAGGMSIGALLTLPTAKGLFHKAILQSGACHTALTKDKSKEIAKAFVDSLGVDVANLRNCSVAELLEAQAQVESKASQLGFPSMPFQPVADGDVLPGLPIDEIRRGSAKDIPILTGTTAEEWKLFAPGRKDLDSLDEDKLHARVKKWAGDFTDQLIETYAHQLEEQNREVSAKEIYIAIITDRIFRLPVIKLLEAQLKFQNDVYTYLFDWPSPAMKGILGACHAVELGFVFGTNECAPRFFGQGEKADKLVLQTMDLWTSFARTAKPSIDDIECPPYDIEDRQTIVLGSDLRIESGPMDKSREIMAKLDDGIIGKL